MTNLEALWTVPTDIDESLDLALIDPSDSQTLKDYEIALAACEFASQTLWALSGRKFHTRTVTEQYVVDRAWIGPYTQSPVRGTAVYDKDWGVYIVDPYDWNSSRIRLNGSPVREVKELRSLADGSLITDYSIATRSTLSIRESVSRGIEITYRYGQEPPVAGRMAAKVMALQFFYLWSGREELCDLPSRVTQVSRENVSWTILDSQDFLDELKTGIYAVDMFLRSVNPDKARVKAKVFSVDIPRGRRRNF